MSPLKLITWSGQANGHESKVKFNSNNQDNRWEKLSTASTTSKPAKDLKRKQEEAQLPPKKKFKQASKSSTTTINPKDYKCGICKGTGHKTTDCRRASQAQKDAHFQNKAAKRNHGAPQYPPPYGYQVPPQYYQAPPQPVQQPQQPPQVVVQQQQPTQSHKGKKNCVYFLNYSQVVAALSSSVGNKIIYITKIKHPNNSLMTVRVWLDR